jgi:glycosyltransferase involved in cell wall biosynthesis
MSVNSYEAIESLPPSISTHGGRDTERMRIAFVHDGLYPFFKGGAERRLFETARALAKHHDVTYVTWQYWDGPSVAMDGGVKLIGVGPAPSFYGADGKRTIRESVSFASRVLRLLATKHFDVVDCCATPIMAIYLSWLTAKLHRRPLVVTWHELWDEYWLDYLPERNAVPCRWRTTSSPSRSSRPESCVGAACRRQSAWSRTASAFATSMRRRLLLMPPTSCLPAGSSTTRRSTG